MNETRGISFMSWITCEFVYAMHLSFVSHSLVWHGVSHSLVWHDSFMCLARDIHAVWYTWYLYIHITSIWYTLLYEATYLYIHAFVTAHSYMYDSSFIHVWLLFHTYIRASHRHPTMHLQDFKHPIPWCNMTHLYIQHVSMIHVKRLWNGFFDYVSQRFIGTRLKDALSDTCLNASGFRL